MESHAKIKHIDEDFPISGINEISWAKAEDIAVDKYWSGIGAPFGRHLKTRILWSETALYVRFEANQDEPLVISEKPKLSSKTNGLWDRDVCEIFLAPNPEQFRRYFEFEVAPTGEWIDLGIHQMPDKRETDWDYSSGMQTFAKIEDNKIWLAMKIEWNAFGRTPKNGEKWKGNIFRCVGSGETRGYLAWQPTLTEVPGFHVPEKFVDFQFVK